MCLQTINNVDNWIWMMMIIRMSKTGPYRVFKLLWRANIPFASRHQHLIHFNRIPGSKHSKIDNYERLINHTSEYSSCLYTSGILGGCPESNSEVSECKEVSWEIQVVPIFTSMTLVERQEEQRQGRFAGLARLFSLPGGDKNLGKISLWVSSGDFPLSIHPSGTPERRAK